MADSIEVKCSRKETIANSLNVTGIGGVNPNGDNWYLTETGAIAGIENGTWTFYTNKNNKRASVKIVTIGGVKHLRTDADTTTVNNLRSLPDCP